MAKPTRLTQEMIEEYGSLGYWDERSITDILKQNAELFPNGEALVVGKRRLSWAGLDRVSTAVAWGMVQLGLEKGDALVAQLPNPSTLLTLLMACQKAGIMSCFSPMTFRQKELGHVIKTIHATAAMTTLDHRNTNYFEIMREVASENQGLKHLLIDGARAPEGAIPFNRLVETTAEEKGLNGALEKRAFDPFEVSIIVLTSGTTGMPKCIEHTGANSKSGGWGVVERARLTHEDVVGNIAPLSGGPGMQNWWAAFQVGAKVCMLDHFTPEEALGLIEREKITYLAAIPTQLIKILKETNPEKYDLSSLKVVRTGAAAFDAALAKETETVLNCKVLIAGGSQETYSFAQSGVDDTAEKRLLTLGKPFPGNEIKIVDGDGKDLPQGKVGRLHVRGAATSMGYFGDLDATLSAWGRLGKEGWYGTGDLARIDEDGFLVLEGREKEIIIRGGQNIYPREIENLLLTHPGVMEAVVLGYSDRLMGERACACVTLSPGGVFSFKEMTSFFKENGLAVHKFPERLEIFDRFPHLVDGQKVNRTALKEIIRKRG